LFENGKAGILLNLLHIYSSAHKMDTKVELFMKQRSSIVSNSSIITQLFPIFILFARPDLLSGLAKSSRKEGKSPPAL